MTGNNDETALVMDLRGEECPVPTLKTVQALKKLRGGVGSTVVVTVDDAVCAADIPYQAGRLGFQAGTETTGPSLWRITLTRKATGRDGVR